MRLLPLVSLPASTYSPMISWQQTDKKTMAHYVDGFLFAVALNKAKDYQKLARRASKVWIEAASQSPETRELNMGVLQT